MRLAVKVAYDGTRFAGSQVQPDVRTVHGEVARALAKLGLPDAHLSWAGRTDAGVSAAANVVTIDDPPLAPASLLPALTYQMEDVWAWAWAEVPAAFEPRRARRRHYRYHLRTKLDARLLEDALRLFEGTHDFTSFARLEPGVTPVRTIFATRVERAGELVLIDVEGESFLWNQVRRMVEAARRTASGEVSPGSIERALHEPAASVDLGVASPEPLVLMDVQYDGVVFQEKRLFERLDKRVDDAEMRVAILRALRR